MRKYYLFVIQNEYYKIYRKSPFVLYKIFENFYSMENYDLHYGVSFFNQLCQPFSVKLLNNYIHDKYICHHLNGKIIEIKSLIEKTFLQIGYGTVVVLTDRELPEIFKVFNIYNRKIFVCEFHRKKFFWLNQKVGKTVNSMK